MSENYYKRVLMFVEEIENYAGQKILEFRSGGKSYSTNLTDPQEFEKSFILGKLKEHPCIIENNQVMANIIEKRYKFTPSTGWKFTHEDIIFNKFIEHYDPLNFKEEVHKSKMQKPQELERLLIHIFPYNKIKIGGHTKYNSPMKASLIIGDASVGKYLAQEDLTVIERKIEKIPEF